MSNTKMRLGPMKVLEAVTTAKASFIETYGMVPNMVLLGTGKYLELRQLATVKSKTVTKDDYVLGMKIFLSDKRDELVVGVIE